MKINGRIDKLHCNHREFFFTRKRSFAWSLRLEDSLPGHLLSIDGIGKRILRSGDLSILSLTVGCINSPAYQQWAANADCYSFLSSPVTFVLPIEYYLP